MTSLITPQQFSVAPLQADAVALPAQPRPDRRWRHVAGNDPQLDDAIARYPRLEAFLQQDIGENVGYQDAVNQLQASFELRDTYAQPTSLDMLINRPRRAPTKPRACWAASAPNAPMPNASSACCRTTATITWSGCSRP